MDADGNAYVTGSGSSTCSNPFISCIPFPTTAGAFQTTGGGVFVTKLNRTGSALVYSTYLGGGNPRGIAVDAAGSAYVTGSAGPSFPTTTGAFQTSAGGGTCFFGFNSSGPCPDAFVTKLDPTGSALVYSTYLGGDFIDSSSGITVDAAGNAYVTGETRSNNFPTTLGAFQTSFGGGVADAFVTKLDPTGSALTYSTYLGGSDRDGASGIAVDTAGNAYVTGGTPSTDFPTTTGAFQTSASGGTCSVPNSPSVPCPNAFVTKLNPDGSALVYSTYLGGSGGNGGAGIAVDAVGNAYVAGSTFSNGVPTTPGAFQPNYGGGERDAFVAKIVDVVLPPLLTTARSEEQPTATRSEESAATGTGSWTRYGSETGTFSGGTVYASNVTASTAMFSFTGTAVSWIGVKCNVCGIATVSIDGGAPTTVNTAGPASSNLTSEPVFSASGLAPGVNHTMVITVTGTTTSADAHIAVDAFDVTR